MISSAVLLCVVQAFATVTIGPEDLIESVTYHLRVNTKRPIELNRDAYHSLRLLIDGASEDDRKNLSDFRLYELRRHVSLRDPNRSIELTDAEREWLAQAVAGQIEPNEIGRRLNQRLRRELDVELRVVPDETRTFRDRNIGLTFDQTKLFDLAQLRSNSFLSPNEVAKELAWTDLAVAHALVEQIEAINDEAVMVTGAPVFHYLEKRGYYFQENPVGRYADEDAEIAVRTTFDLPVPDGHVIAARVQLERTGLPLAEVIRVLDVLNARTPGLVEKLEIRLRRRTIRFERRGGRLLGCAAYL